MYQHKHAYVYEYLMKRHKPDRGYERCMYTLFTDIEGPNSIKNKQLLEQGFRIGLGFKPRHVRYRHDKYSKK
jgi:hypothetical protein